MAASAGAAHSPGRDLCVPYTTQSAAKTVFLAANFSSSSNSSLGRQTTRT